jgi:hypothetical protein
LKIIQRDMKRGPFKLIVFTGILMFLYSSSGCEDIGYKSDGTGTLQGKISIGPICPVETIPPNPACQPTAETYKTYPVSVYTTDMKIKITDIQPSLNGSYATTIPFGTFLVVLDRQTTIGGSNLPVTIEIKEGEVTKLDINIDTGIR